MYLDTFTLPIDFEEPMIQKQCAHNGGIYGYIDNTYPVSYTHLSCHSLRHTFTTRMCEAGVNVKVIQDTLGHKDISTCLLYTSIRK